jgi:hypothetical protein
VERPGKAAQVDCRKEPRALSDRPGVITANGESRLKAIWRNTPPSRFC